MVVHGKVAETPEGSLGRPMRVRRERSAGAHEMQRRHPSSRVLLNLASVWRLLLDQRDISRTSWPAYADFPRDTCRSSRAESAVPASRLGHRDNEFDERVAP